MAFVKLYNINKGEAALMHILECDPEQILIKNKRAFNFVFRETGATAQPDSMVFHSLEICQTQIYSACLFFFINQLSYVLCFTSYHFACITLIFTWLLLIS
jgi:hypothetical protein